MISKIIFLTNSIILQTASEVIKNNQNVDESHIPALAELLTKAVVEKNYFMITGIFLMFTIFLLRKFLLPRIMSDEKLKTHTPTLTIIISLLVGVASWLMNPNLNIFEILMTSISTSLVAAGTWETIGKPVSKIDLIDKISDKIKNIKKDSKE